MIIERGKKTLEKLPSNDKYIDVFSYECTQVSTYVCVCRYVCMMYDVWCNYSRSSNRTNNNSRDNDRRSSGSVNGSNLKSMLNCLSACLSVCLFVSLFVSVEKIAIGRRLPKFLLPALTVTALRVVNFSHTRKT